MQFDYFIYNAFDSTIAALLKVVLIYSHANYFTLMSIAAIAGLGIGAIISLAKSATDGKGNLLTFLIPTVLGMAIFFSLIIPRGTLHVYDTGTNQYQALDLPILIVAIAGPINYIERTLIDIIDDSASYVSGLSNYRTDSGGLSFQMIKDANNAAKDYRSVYFKRSISTYINECVGPALLFSGAGDLDALQGEDMLVYFNTLTPVYNGNTTWFDSVNRAGSTVTCGTALTNIQNEFLDTLPNDALVREACSSAGFNVGTPALLAQCRNKIEAKLISGGKLTSIAKLFEGRLITSAIQDAMNQGNINGAITQYANRNIQVSNIGAAQIANDWIPVIRSVVIAITFGLTPLIGLFLVTPLAFRVIGFIFGMFIWLSIWSVTDALVHSYSVDLAMKIFDGIFQGTIGMNEIIAMPDALDKAAGVFGKSRTIAVSLSTVIMYSLFKFGGVALAQAAGRFSENAQAAGERSGMTMGTLEGQGSYIAGSNNGAAKMAAIDSFGPQAMGNAASMTEIGKTGGEVQTMQKLSENNGTDINSAMSAGTLLAKSNSTSTRAKVGDNEAIEKVAAAEGESASELRERISGVTTAASSGKANADVHTADQSGKSVTRQAYDNAVDQNSRVNSQTDANKEVTDSRFDGNTKDFMDSSTTTQYGVLGKEALDIAKTKSPALAASAAGRVDPNANVIVTDQPGGGDPGSPSANFTIGSSAKASNEKSVINTNKDDFTTNAASLMNSFGEGSSVAEGNNALDSLMAMDNEGILQTAQDMARFSSLGYQAESIGEQDRIGTSTKGGVTWNTEKGALTKYLSMLSGVKLNVATSGDASSHTTDGSNTNAVGVKMADEMQSIVGELKDSLKGDSSTSGSEAAYDVARERMGQLVHNSTQGLIDSNIDEVNDERVPHLNTGNQTSSDSSGSFENFKKQSQDNIQESASNVGDAAAAIKENATSSIETIMGNNDGDMNAIMAIISDSGSKEEAVQELTDRKIQYTDPKIMDGAIDEAGGFAELKAFTKEHIKSWLENNENAENAEDDDPSGIAIELYNRK